MVGTLCRPYHDAFLANGPTGQPVNFSGLSTQPSLQSSSLRRPNRRPLTASR